MENILADLDEVYKKYNKEQIDKDCNMKYSDCGLCDNFKPKKQSKNENITRTSTTNN